MKYSEINNLQVQELRKRLAQNRQALFDARMKHKMQRLSNMMELRNFKRDIARLETALSALPESAFVSDKKKDPVKVESKVKKMREPKPETVKKQEKTKEPVKKVTSSASSKIKSAPDKKTEVKKPVQEKQEKKVARKDSSKWFGFFGSKKQSAGERKSAAGKKRFFRRKSV